MRWFNKSRNGGSDFSRRPVRIELARPEQHEAAEPESRPPYKRQRWRAAQATRLPSIVPLTRRLKAPRETRALDLGVQPRRRLTTAPSLGDCPSPECPVLRSSGHSTQAWL